MYVTCPYRGEGEALPPTISKHPSGKGGCYCQKNDVQVHSATMHLSSNVSLSCVLGWRCIAAGTKGCVCGEGTGDRICVLSLSNEIEMDGAFFPTWLSSLSFLFVLVSSLCIFPFLSVLCISGTTPVYRGGRVPSELTTLHHSTAQLV